MIQREYFGAQVIKGLGVFRHSLDAHFGGLEEAVLWRFADEYQSRCLAKESESCVIVVVVVLDAADRR